MEEDSEAGLIGAGAAAAGVQLSGVARTMSGAAPE
jgi:hypothetical protein